MAKAGGKFSSYRLRHGGCATVGGRPILFEADPRGQAPPKKRQYLKWKQEEVLRRVHREYPDGDIPGTTEVLQAISDKNFHPVYNTVHAALGRKRPRK